MLRIAPFGSFADGQPNWLSRVVYGHTAVNAGVVKLGLATTACASSSSESILQATSLVQINGPACRRNRPSSSLPDEIPENLSLCMRKFGKYLAISDNTECHFPLFDHYYVAQIGERFNCVFRIVIVPRHIVVIQKRE
jgi:hypothetical protein